MLQFKREYTLVNSLGNYSTYEVATFDLAIDVEYFLPRLLTQSNVIEITITNNGTYCTGMERLVRKANDKKGISIAIITNKVVKIEPYDKEEHGAYCD